MTLVLALSPWLLFAAYLAARVRFPRPLPRVTDGETAALPSVSVIVPARNEAHNLPRCVASLAASTYPDFEIVVVDDRSQDDTARVARDLDGGNARRYAVVEGQALPEGWFGKPWACSQGARVARGDLLLFTDADTEHGPRLLSRAVAGMEEDGADFVTLLGRQEMRTFWERLFQPHFFALISFRYPDCRQPLPARRWRDAIANGQFILVRRDAYDDLGGHEAVAGEVVEDLRLAQEWVRQGRRVSIREAEDAFSTRMYRSLGELLEGWSKNLFTASRQSVPGFLAPVIAPLSLLVGAAFWLAPPVVATVMLAGGPPAWEAAPDLAAWAVSVTALSVGFWMATCLRLGAPPAYGLLYPLGVAGVGYVYLLSWIRGSRIRWKGRTYGGAGRGPGPRQERQRS